MTLQNQAKTEIKKSLKKSVQKIKSFKSMPELLNNWEIKEVLTAGQYKKAKENILTLAEVKKIAVNRLNQKYEKRLVKTLEKIENLLNSSKFIGVTASIEWKKSRTWGANPSGDYRNCYFFKHFGAVTGCGYDKLSTLTANMFDEDEQLMGVIARYCQKNHINNNNIESKLGYGIRMYNGMPTFSGGVGVSCHVSILKKIGFEVAHVSGNTYDHITINSAKAMKKYNTIGA